MCVSFSSPLPYYIHLSTNLSKDYTLKHSSHCCTLRFHAHIYYLVCSDRSEFDTETWCEGKHPIYYVALIPEGYDCDREYHFMTTNDKWFWASPYAE